MATHEVTISVDCVLDPSEVTVDTGLPDKVKITNHSGAAVILTYSMRNPFSDINDMVFEKVPHGQSIEHTVRANLAKKELYFVYVYCVGCDASPRIRIITASSSS